MRPAALPRSYLFVPGDRPERFAKAFASGADAVVIDLEDAVAPAAKAAARSALADWLAAAAPSGEGPAVQTVVRVNAPGTPDLLLDLALLAARHPPALALMLPKAEAPQSLAPLRDACPGARLLPLIESARGVLEARALASAPGVERLVFGTIDYALEMDLAAGDGPPAGLDIAAAMIAMASRAAGIGPPVAGVTTAVDDGAALRADLARARGLGFGAKLCIHPRQVGPLHAALAPTAAELEHAHRVVAAAQRAGGAAVQLDGRMVDTPVIEAARRVIARAA